MLKNRITSWLIATAFIILLIFGSVFGFNYYEPTQQQAEQEAKEQSEAKAIEILASERVAYYTKVLAIFTGALAAFGILQIAFLIRAENTSRKSADAAKISADAAVIGSMPILAPLVIQRAGNIYPSNLIEQPYVPELTFVFQNFGASPGIVRSVNTELILVDKEELPDIDFSKLSNVHHERIIPGNLIGEDAITSGSGVTCPAFRPINRDEHQLLLNEAITGTYKRFFLVGRVIYDDFLDMRHTATFCLKVRKGGYQGQHGGLRYNRITREKIPKDE